MAASIKRATARSEKNHRLSRWIVIDLMYNENMAELLERLREDYPEIRFREGKKFAFRPARTIIFEPALGEDTKKGVTVASDEQRFWQLQLLHELGHAVLEHKNFATDPERLKMERVAWEKAQELCNIYNVAYDEEFVEAKLDTYRDWLHQKSRCPQCGLTRFQTLDGNYHCPGCDL